MKLRARTREGTTNVDIDDTASVGDLKQILSALNISSGFPPRKIDVPDSTQLTDVLRNGDLIIAEGKLPPSATTKKQTMPAANAPSKETAPAPLREQSTSVAEHGTVLMREVPDDNSCLFRSVNALLGYPTRSAAYLRNIIAEKVTSDTDTYSEAVLGKSTQEYATWIRSENAWGGAIELAILASHFTIQLAAFDVNTMRLDQYGEGSNFAQIAFLIYNGIHYNYAALALDQTSSDLDVVQFDPKDSIVRGKVRTVAQLLHDSRKYTDTASFKLKCLQCGTKLKGEKQALDHAKATGHSQFDEK